MTEPGKTDRTWLCSILFTDIVGYSARSVERQMRWKERFNSHLMDSILDIPESDRVILDTGDGAAVCFLGAPEAAMFTALKLLEFCVAEEGEQSHGMRVRFGINLGPVRLVRDVNGNLNALGDGINDAQRIMSFAGPNQILVSRSFFDVVSRLSDDYSRLFRLKGIERDKHVREHTVYFLSLPGSEGPAEILDGLPQPADTVHDPASNRSATKSATHNTRPRWLGASIAAAVILAGIAGWTFRHLTSRDRISVPELTLLSPDDRYSYTAPAISPDGKFVAYVSDRSGKSELWLQQVGGGVPIQLTHSQNEVIRAAFFPDGTRNLYLTHSSAPERQDSLEVVSTLGGEPHVIVTGVLPYTPKMPDFAISPNGSRVAYVEVSAASPKRPALTILPVDGGPTRSLPAWNDVQLNGAFAPFVQWTPDNHFLICLGSRHADASSFDQWDWFLLPLDGGRAVATGTGDRLRTAGFSFTYPTAILGDRVLFSGPGAERGHVWMMNTLPDTWRTDGSAQQLSFGTEDEVAFSVSSDGVAGIQSGKRRSDLYMVPLDPRTGKASSATLRLTQDTQDKILSDSIVGGGGDPRLVYFSVHAANPNTSVAYSLDVENGKRTRLGTVPGIGATWAVSRDGRQVAYSLPRGDRFSIRVVAAGSPINSGRQICRECGVASAFSPDGHFLLIYDFGGSLRSDRHRKASVHLLDLSSGKDKPWLADPTDSIEAQGLFGEQGAWVVVSVRAAGPSALPDQTYIVPWRESPVARSEWIAVPARDVRFSAVSNLVYFFRNSALMAAKFDPAMKRFSTPYEVKVIPGAQPPPTPADAWTVRGPGLVFARFETRGSVWLMKVPE